MLVGVSMEMGGQAENMNCKPISCPRNMSNKSSQSIGFKKAEIIEIYLQSYANFQTSSESIFWHLVLFLV